MLCLRMGTLNSSDGTPKCCMRAYSSGLWRKEKRKKEKEEEEEEKGEWSVFMDLGVILGFLDQLDQDQRIAS